MVVEYVRYRVPAEVRSGFLLGFAHAVKQLDRSGACLGYELTQSMDDPEVMVLRIEWSKTSGAVPLRNSAFVPGLIEQGSPFLDLVTGHQLFRLTGISKHH